MSIAASVKALQGKVDLAKLRAEKRVTAYVEERVRTIFTDIVKHTPQFSSNLVYNWHIEYGTYRGIYLYEEDARHENNSSEGAARRAYKRMESKGGPYKRGDSYGVNMVLGREFTKLDGIKDVVAGRIRWNSKIYFVNTTPYAGAIDQGLGPLDGDEFRQIRPENLYYGKTFLMTRAKKKYPELK